MNIIEKLETKIFKKSKLKKENNFKHKNYSSPYLKYNSPNNIMKPESGQQI
jgi:hypothetical protein